MEPNNCVERTRKTAPLTQSVRAACAARTASGMIDPIVLAAQRLEQ